MSDYKDEDGKATTLHHLCRTSPEWAASRIEFLTTECAEAKELVDKLIRNARIPQSTDASVIKAYYDRYTGHNSNARRIRVFERSHRKFRNAYRELANRNEKENKK